MKKILLGILIGFISHKVINYTYDASFDKAFSSDTCRQVYREAIAKNADAPLSARFSCTYSEMGPVNYLGYLLIRPNASDIGEKWTF